MKLQPKTPREKSSVVIATDDVDLTIGSIEEALDADPLLVPQEVGGADRSPRRTPPPARGAAPRKHLPIAMPMPGKFMPKTRYLRLFLAKALSYLPLFNVFRTRWDPMPIKSVPYETLVLGFGRPGSGKYVRIVSPILALCDEPIVYFDPQGEAERDAPLRRALGRRVFVFNSTYADCASVNVLARVSASDAGFTNFVNEIASVMMPLGEVKEDREHRQYTLNALKIAIANEVAEAEYDGREPLISRAVANVRRADLEQYLQACATHGVIAFRDLAADLLGDLASAPAALSNIKFFIRSELSALSDPQQARMVDGTTSSRADPAAMVGDGPEKDDWFINPPHEVRQSAAVYRLIMYSVMRARYRLSAEAARKIPVNTIFLIDEFPKVVGAAAEMFDELVARARQKGCRPIYLAQSMDQISSICGESKLKDWLNAASIRIFLSPDRGDAMNYVREEAGDYYELRVTHNADGASDGSNYTFEWAATPNLSEAKLKSIVDGQFIALYSSVGCGMQVIFDTGPDFLRAPLFRRYIRSVQRRFAFRPGDWGGADMAPGGPVDTPPAIEPETAAGAIAAG